MFDTRMYNTLVNYPHGRAIFGVARFYDGTFGGDRGAVAIAIKCAELAAFFNWHAGALDAMDNACYLIGVDPALVESYIGRRFADILPDIESAVKARTVSA